MTMNLACFTKTPFLNNPLETKDDLRRFCVGILDPLAAHTSPGGARVHLGYTGTHYDETAAQLEGFSRPLWGLTALLAGGGEYEGKERWVRGFESGTNPDHEEFWGDMRNKDQRMVECSAIGYSIAVAKEHLWDPLSVVGKETMGRWLGGMNDKEMPNTNWLWFRVFANLGLHKVGSQYADVNRMKADLDHLDTFYIGDGWSRDGPEGVIMLDYYASSFAIQYAQLVYSKLARDVDPARCDEFRSRASQFAQDFVHYFDEEGRAVTFGRSLTYRFAMSSFWGAVAFADLELPAPLTWGVVKGLQLRNLRYWMRQPGAYNADGTFTIGYCYPNFAFTENYNSPGSPYWACKSFIALNLPETHPFWASAEEPYPQVLRNTVKVLKHPLHISTNLGGHTFILSSGQQASYALRASAAKYGKMSYSSAFGYSVPVGHQTLEEQGGDSTLLLSDDSGESWKVRRETREARFETSANGSTTWLRSMWYPWSDVEVETWLVPPTKEVPLWYLRVHRVRSSRKLWSAEGAWAIYGQRGDGRHLDTSQGENVGTLEDVGSARATSLGGVSAISALESSTARFGKAVRMDAGSNLMVPRSILPTLMGEQDGTGTDEWLVTAIFGLPSVGDQGVASGWETEWKKKPAVPEDISKLIHL